jgi:hypothetical protein
MWNHKSNWKEKLPCCTARANRGDCHLPLATTPVEMCRRLGRVPSFSPREG